MYPLLFSVRKIRNGKDGKREKCRAVVEAERKKETLYLGCRESVLLLYRLFVR